MFFNLDCLLGSMPTLLCFSEVTDYDLRRLLKYLEGRKITPQGTSQTLLFRVIDDMRAKEATPADFVEVRGLIAARMAGELVCEVYEYDDEDEYFDYDEAA